ncbi:hypothetical protein FGO68_gene300 [Halteria grandinella]|uniref:Uncharacterized protein n=1 Tax=Halteria grandinella TaxID=5974 RepID=A0A8J8NNL7_HALGN|nr:hypothetical protein FGO68_gene300 [Halteria grandinella]
MIDDNQSGQNLEQGQGSEQMVKKFNLYKAASILGAATGSLSLIGCLIERLVKKKVQVSGRKKWMLRKAVRKGTCLFSRSRTLKDCERDTLQRQKLEITQTTNETSVNQSLPQQLNRQVFYITDSQKQENQDYYGEEIDDEEENVGKRGPVELSFAQQCIEEVVMTEGSHSPESSSSNDIRESQVHLKYIHK